MRAAILFSLTAIGFFSSAVNAQITPYQRPKPIKPNGAGVFFDKTLHNAKAWDGREAGDYSLKFKINGIKVGDTVYLADYHLDGKYLRDTTVVDKKGIADFTGKQKLQRGMYLFVLPQKRGFFEFIVDDDQNFLITSDTSFYEGDYYSKMKITGSDQNQGFLDYQLGKSRIVEQIIKIDDQLKKDTTKATKDLLGKERTALMEKKNNYDADYIKAHPDHILSRFLYAMVDADFPTELPTKADGTKDSTYPYRYYRAHYWDHVDLGEDALVRMPVNILKQKLDIYFDKVIISDADTCIQECNMLMKKSENTIEVEKYIIWYLTNRFETSNIMGLDRVFIHMAFESYCKGKAWWADSGTIAKMCEHAVDMNETVIGRTAPALELQDSKGEWVQTNEIPASYTILIFWDPTCGHCREVMPKLAKVYEENKAKGWKVIALHSADKGKEFDEYYKEHPESQPFLHLIRGTVRSQYWADQLQRYYVIASPTIFVLDQNKKILANRIDVDKLADFIDYMDKHKNDKANGQF